MFEVIGTKFALFDGRKIGWCSLRHRFAPHSNTCTFIKAYVIPNEISSDSRQHDKVRQGPRFKLPTSFSSSSFSIVVTRSLSSFQDHHHHPMPTIDGFRQSLVDDERTARSSSPRPHLPLHLRGKTIFYPRNLT